MNTFFKKFLPKKWVEEKNEITLTPQSGVKLFLIEFFKLAIFAIITIFLVRYFLFKPFYVRGASMEPNFFDKEYLIIDEITYRLRAPERGEIIVFHYPKNESEYFIKRIIGLPGEKVKVQDGNVIIYNQENPEGLVLQESYLPAGLKNQPNVTHNLSSAQYFVMGDNRNNSFDSRFFGPIDQKEFVGRVWLRGWPFYRVKLFSAPVNYNF